VVVVVTLTGMTVIETEETIITAAIEIETEIGTRIEIPPPPPVVGAAAVEVLLVTTAEPLEERKPHTRSNKKKKTFEMKC
jgi:hypothetical protein